MAIRSDRSTSPPGSGRPLARRLFIVARMVVLVCVASAFTGADSAPGNGQATTVPSAAGAAPAAAAAAVPPDVVQALRGLKAPSPSARQKVYDLLAERGDARIIPALTAFTAGQLMLRDGRLMMYGPGKEAKVDGQVVRAFPLLDALTGEPIPGPDGQPTVEKINLAKAFRAPLGETQKKPVKNLILTLSLLHPDPERRLESIRSAGERAARVFPDPGDEERVTNALKAYVEQAKRASAPAGAGAAATTQPVALAVASPVEADLLAAIEAALAEKPAGLRAPVPSAEATAKVAAAVAAAQGGDAAKGAEPTTLPAADRKVAEARVRLAEELSTYKVRLDALAESTDEMPAFAAAFDRQLAADPNGRFAPALTEAKALTDAALGDGPARASAVAALGGFATSRAENVLRKLYEAAVRTGDRDLADAVEPNLAKAAGYQRKVRFAQYTFAGLSAGSILVLMALGLGIIFGLMGVINMAHGEFMMIGAFTTLAVASWFKSSLPGAYDWFPLVAVPAAFLVAGSVGLLTEFFVVRHLYGRPLETLLATIGVGFILVQAVRELFGNNVSYGAPSWMQGSWEVATDLKLNLARLWTVAYCALCVGVVYFMVNRTKLGLLLRATTQNRQMAAALGVPTRRVDALTFAFGTGLAGMAGVVVPMVDKINPGMGQDYVVESFMVVVVGGVGKLAGAIVAGFGLGFVGKYLEPILGSLKAFAATSSVFGKVLVLAAIVMFLQWRPSGLFPAKGRTADA